jgi:hypothetical protein
LLLGSFPDPQNAAFQVIKLTEGALASSLLASFMEAHHGLHLSSEGELLLRGEELMASNFTEKGTQGTSHRSKKHGHVQYLVDGKGTMGKATRRFPYSYFVSYSTFLRNDLRFLFLFAVPLPLVSLPIPAASP